MTTLLGRVGLSSRRGRVIAMLGAASLAITVLAVAAAGSSLSYYVTPEEFAQELDPEGSNWRVGGRVVEGSVEEFNGRPVRFTIEGERGETMEISYDGIVPSLFGPRSFVVVDGVADGPLHLRASSVIVKHESEFVTDETDASIAP